MKRSSPGGPARQAHGTRKPGLCEDVQSCTLREEVEEWHRCSGNEQLHLLLVLSVKAVRSSASRFLREEQSIGEGREFT